MHCHKCVHVSPANTKTKVITALSSPITQDNARELLQHKYLYKDKKKESIFFL
uniref:Uncharacterized protein n=1 Tax=Rhizophora mucronata TaxID=61149 RepID=A0A2P2ITZ6_RHIMU